MFLFKQGSRNQADNKAKNLDYQDNIKRFFKVRVADMDTVDRYLRFLPPEELEQLKHKMLQHLLRAKVFYKHRLLDRYYMLSIDGTGLQSYDYEPYPGCSFKTLKNGKKIWTTYVLEAKLVTHSGFSLSIATEWIENPTDKDYNKQDSEYKAFMRLAKKIKKLFPQMSIVLLLDGLYPKEPVFNLCRNYNWKFIITLKDGSLKTIQEQLSDKKLEKNYKKEQIIEADTTHWKINNYTIFEKIEFRGQNFWVLENIYQTEHKKSREKIKKRFIYITNIQTDRKNIHKISEGGRTRWKIENQGFREQKIDYKIEHKYSRTNFNATKNYYQLLQIAHIINQLMYKLQEIKIMLKQYGLTEKALLLMIISAFVSQNLTEIDLIENNLKKKQQLRY